VRSGPIWRIAECALLERLGAERTDELASKYKGMNTLDVARVIHAELKPSLSVEKCQRIIRSRLIEEFMHGVPAMPGAVELVRRLAARRYPLALASGSPMEAIEPTLVRLGIRECFDQVVSSEMVKRGKPHPDVFLKAAELLRAEPAECVVFEDSLVGVQAAAAAGMSCYAVPSGHFEEIAKLATRVYRSLEEVELGGEPVSAE